MMVNKKILGVITARGGSKGLPGKNIKILGNHPLIFYTIEVAKKSKLITDLIVSTDDEKIAKICEDFGARVPFLRPAELANDTSGHLEVMRHAIKFMEDNKGIVYDYAVILQPTSPFRTVDDIDRTIEKILEHKADSAFSMTEIIGREHPLKAKKMDGDKVVSYCNDFIEPTQRQKLPPAFKRSGAVYVTKRDIIMNENKLWGDFVVGYLIPKERYVDIDTESDWILAEYMYKYLEKQGFFKDVV
jgi:CMP-N-acetylneuraminic acid synthetase